MANLRDLKKDINYLASEIVTQGYMKLSLMEEIKEENMVPVLSEAIEMRNEFIARANHPDGKDNKKLVKSYYKKLREDLLKKTMELLEKLEAVK